MCPEPNLPQTRLSPGTSLSWSRRQDPTDCRPRGPRLGSACEILTPLGPLRRVPSLRGPRPCHPAPQRPPQPHGPPAPAPQLLSRHTPCPQSVPSEGSSARPSTQHQSHRRLPGQCTTSSADQRPFCQASSLRTPGLTGRPRAGQLRPALPLSPACLLQARWHSRLRRLPPLPRRQTTPRWPPHTP